MAIILENIIPDLIELDQTGFIKNRHTQYNVKHALYLIDNIYKRKSKLLAISLDAEKAFCALGVFVFGVEAFWL